jgi:hypothetical protein
MGFVLVRLQAQQVRQRHLDADRARKTHAEQLVHRHLF